MEVILGFWGPRGQRRPFLARGPGRLPHNRARSNAAPPGIPGRGRTFKCPGKPMLIFQVDTGKWVVVISLYCISAYSDPHPKSFPDG